MLTILVALKTQSMVRYHVVVMQYPKCGFTLAIRQICDTQRERQVVILILLRGTRVIRTHRMHKKLYVLVFSPRIFCPDYCVLS